MQLTLSALPYCGDDRVDLLPGRLSLCWQGSEAVLSGHDVAGWQAWYRGRMAGLVAWPDDGPGGVAGWQAWYRGRMAGPVAWPDGGPGGAVSVRAMKKADYVRVNTPMGQIILIIVKNH